MNYDFHLFGQFPGGYVQYPDDFTSSIFNNVDYRLDTESQMLVVRDGHMVYYNYYRRIGGSSNGVQNYLGMSICFNDVYCNKLSVLFDVFEQLVLKLAADDIILRQLKNGRLVANTSVLYDKVAEIDSLCAYIDKRFNELPAESIQTVPSLNYGIGAGLVKDLPVEYADMLIPDAITRSNRIRIKKDEAPILKIEEEETEQTSGYHDQEPSNETHKGYNPGSSDSESGKERRGKGGLIALFVVLAAALLLIFVPDWKNGGLFKEPAPPPVYVNGYEFVDLGLSVLWATKNVGASSKYEKGHYYAWGEYRPKSRYSHTNYKYCTDVTRFSKYVPYDKYEYSSYGYPDGKVKLENMDDAAYKNWGSPCRMPTKENFAELVNKCAHRWTTQNGVSGMLFTARTGNSIFFPAGGYFKSDEQRDYGLKGLYLCSDLYTEKPNSAYRFYINNDSQPGVLYSGRYYGYSVRAVVDRNAVR